MSILPTILFTVTSRILMLLKFLLFAFSFIELSRYRAAKRKPNVKRIPFLSRVSSSYISFLYS